MNTQLDNEELDIDNEELDTQTTWKDHFTSFLDVVKCSLAMREDGATMSSIMPGLKGNPAQYFFLLSYPAISLPSSDDLVHWSFDGKTITLEVPADPDLIQARQELDKLMAPGGSIPMVCDSFKQLVSSDWLKAHAAKTADFLLLSSAVALTTNIHNTLRDLEGLQQSIRDRMNKEVATIKQEFYAEIGFTPRTTYNYCWEDDGTGKTVFFNSNTLQVCVQSDVRLAAQEKAEFDLDQHLSVQMKQHPVFGPRLDNIENRQEAMTKALLSQQTLDQLKYWSSYPSYIVYLLGREVFTVQEIVNWDLDDYIKSMRDKMLSLETACHFNSNE